MLEYKLLFVQVGASIHALQSTPPMFGSTALPAREGEGVREKLMTYWQVLLADLNSLY